ncbi:hypothetical protein [Sulfuriflexus sp.]|uniref:hypothetical protein n=1 Tax=Sulfuriflexus sp. TaxID=2015443 RepID=UPI0028CCFDAC|nr:hypothetical protein [Sulfuriflexus sp.]MDT8405556.1 hypothetical protein [Sulfuriflexus sp.]
MAVIFLFATESDYRFHDFLFIFWQELLGNGPGLESEEKILFVTGKVISAVLALILPTVLLGSVVYKFFVLQKDNIIFRNKCEICRVNGQDYINVGFYISSALKFHDLSFNAFVRTYETAREDGKPGQYPMNTFPIEMPENMTFQLPYNFVPSNISIPVSVVNGAGDHENETSAIVLQKKATAYELLRAGEATTLDMEKGDFCELFIVASAEVPELQSSIKEIKCYSIPADIAVEGLARMRTRLEKQQGRFVTENWTDF